MMVATILLVGLTEALPAQSRPSSVSRPSACAQSLADAAADGATAEICAGDQAARLANAAPKDSAERTRQLRTAAEHYRRAATITSKVATKVLALNLLADAYDAQYLNDLKQMEAVLREVIALTPDDLAPVFRLAKVQEDEGLVDAAEETLLDARRRQPDAVEPYRMLAQFYARRVTALYNQATQSARQAATNPGDRDENGVYQVGGAITAPARVDVPQYPPDARAAGITGVVLAEIVIDTSGSVSDAKVVRSVPLLDDAALHAVRSWHYAPTMVNGEPVPVRMTVTVNFSMPVASPPTPRPPNR
jgi:protein TonB